MDKHTSDNLDMGDQLYNYVVWECVDWIWLSFFLGIFRFVGAFGS